MFYKALINIVTEGFDHAPYQVPDPDHGTVLTTQYTNYTLQNAAFQFMTNATPQLLRPILLKEPYRTTPHHFYQHNQTNIPPTNFPLTGYPYIMIPHPYTNDLTLGRVHARDLTTHRLFIQHYVIVTEPIDSHPLKNTHRNAAAKGHIKYSTTRSASAIKQCPGCNQHNQDALNQANRLARRNCRHKITCLFTQDTNAATILPIKSHQLYQDIILLQQPINNLLNTNHSNILPSPSTPIDRSGLNTPHQPTPDNVDIDRIVISSSVNIQLIDRLINSPDIASQLKQAAQALESTNILSFYTDGSLVRSTPINDVMGLGWVNENNEELRFQASATLWPSSTKAEMLACLTALITSPRHAKVTIHTDSKATIDGFQRLPEVSRLSIRKREKITNYPLWCMISYIIAQLDLEVIMKKVKAHSGDRLNDLADELAKNAVIHSLRLILNLTLIPTLRMIMTCDNLHIEMSSRKCLKHLSHANNFYQFLLLRRSTDLLLLSEQHCI